MSDEKSVRTYFGNVRTQPENGEASDQSIVVKCTGRWVCPHEPTHAGKGDEAADECLAMMRGGK